MKNILITGMSGLIGGLLRKRMEDVGGYRLTALNRSAVDGVRTVQADISDMEAIRPAFTGQDVVVHLAAFRKYQPIESLVNANVTGTYNVYEAARQAGVKRVVFASSGATVLGYEKEHPYDLIAQGRYEDVPATWPMITHAMTRPNSPYGASKVWGEALGRYFSDTHGLSILCIRFGGVPIVDGPGKDLSKYLSHRDAVNIIMSCVEAPDDLRYDIFFATSKNRWGYRDLEHPRQVLGWEPQDSADAFK